MGHDREGLDDHDPGGPISLLSRRLERALKEHRPALAMRAAKMCRTLVEAEDLVGDVMLYAVSHSEKFLQHPNPRAWLLRVMGNRYIDYCRSPKPCAMEAGQLALHSVEDMRFARWETYESLSLAIQALPDHLAGVIRMRLEGLTLKSIGERLGVSTAEAGRLSARAERQLSDFFKRDR